MFNSAGKGPVTFTPGRVLGGASFADYDSNQTLYVGVDPADPNRVLVRKLVQVNNNTYCYEETRITPTDQRVPTVHTQLFRIGDFDLHEELTPEELSIRGRFRPLPNVLGYSLFYKQLSSFGFPHMSIVENSLWKQAGGTIREWLRDFRDRRDMAYYLKRQFKSRY